MVYWNDTVLLYFFLIFSGFSIVYLVENTRTRKRFAVKKIICHGRDDQKAALQEIDYHKMVDHPNIIRCIDSTVIGSPDPVLNSTSEVLLLLPYYPVRCEIQNVRLII